MGPRRPLDGRDCKAISRGGVALPKTSMSLVIRRRAQRAAYAVSRSVLYRQLFPARGDTCAGRRFLRAAVGDRHVAHPGARRRGNLATCVLDRTSGLGDGLRHHGHLIRQSPPQSLIGRTSSAGRVRKSAIGADVGSPRRGDCSRASGTTEFHSHHTSHLTPVLAMRPPGSTTPRRRHLAPLQRCEMTLTGHDGCAAVLRVRN